jgi:hypothetical protein
MIIGQLQPGGVWRITDVPWPRSARLAEQTWTANQWIRATMPTSSTRFNVGPWV